MSRKVIAVVLLASAMWALSAGAQDAETDQQTQAKAIINNQDQAIAARAAAGCGPNEIQFDIKTDKTQHPQASPDAARAVIYVFSEPAEFPNVRVGMDGKWVGANHGESYFFFTAEPGEHRLCWDVQKGQEKLSNQGAATTFIAEAGKAYFFRTTLHGSSETETRRKIERLDGAEGMFLVSSWPLSSSRPRPPHED